MSDNKRDMSVGTATPPSRLINRELSWLEFNARVLDLAEDETVPLLDRVRFCAIFSSNLDEFFMVRVAGLLEQAESGYHVLSADGLTPAEALATIRRRIVELTRRQSGAWRTMLRPALAAAGINVVDLSECTDGELAKLQKIYEREVYPILTPLAVGPGQPFPYISGLSLSLAVTVRDPATGEERLARVKVPEGLDRFVSTGERLVRLESLIGHFLSTLFPGMEISDRAAFRVTRNADFDVSDDADDLLGAVESELAQRRFGEVVRLEISTSASKQLRNRLMAGLGVTKDQVYEIERPLDLADLSELAGIDRPDLKSPAWAPVVPPRFSGTVSPRDMFEEIARGDILHHPPYESFRASFEAFAGAAAADPDVIAMKTTVYRTGDDSKLISALIDCAEDGKQALCVVELKARFDERRNIQWARKMEQTGVHVVHGFPNLKVHAKMTLVVRREGNQLRRYVHVGTGNYNADTARIYEDVGLFTADEDIAADVADLFNYVTGFGRPKAFRKLLIAPFTMKARLIEEIRRVAAASQAGERARIRIKLNSLVDSTMIDELYAASQAGARIDLCTRAVCMLRPGVPGLSERIRVRSIVGRFLEHSRIYEFQTSEATSVYMGSADLMPRNLERRIEVLVPVEQSRPKQELLAILDSVFADTTNAWELDPDGSWARPVAGSGERPRTHQVAMQRRATARARRYGDAARRASDDVRA